MQKGWKALKGYERHVLPSHRVYLPKVHLAGVAVLDISGVPSSLEFFSQAISMNEFQLQNNADFSKCSDASIKLVGIRRGGYVKLWCWNIQERFVS